MKTKLKLLTKIGIFLFGISLFFTSCEKDETNIIENQEHVGKNPNEVSLEKFRKTTYIDDIDSFVKKSNEKNNNIFARENSELTFDDFIINTDLIYQCTLNDGNVSFSFNIEPIVECLPTEEFNLVIKQDEQGHWQSKIYQLNANTDGTVQNRFSSIEEIYSSNGLPDGVAARWVGMWGETTTYHCTNTGSCSSGTCDNCGLCVTTTITYELVYIDESNPSGSGGDPNFNYNGGGGGGSSMPHMAERNQLIELLDLQPGSQQHMWVSSSAPLAQMEVLLDYLDDNRIISPVGSPQISTDAKNFTNEIIMLLHWNSSGNSERDLNALNFIVEAKKQDKIYNNIDSDFLMSVNQYMNIDVSNSDLHDPITIHLIMKMALIRATQPNICDGLAEWQCNLKVFWEASKDVVHITLDGFGLIPVVGEIADLINGGLYLIEGDGVNATLSFAATVPIAGWTATGAKYAIKIVDASQTAMTIATKVKLTWKVVGNTIEFGSSSLLRKVLGITHISQQAHHLIPWAIRNHDVVQKAAKSGSAFHMNEALNGIAVASWRNQPNHNNYNDLIEFKLNEFNTITNPNATVDEAYDFVSDLINDIRDWVINNPNSHLNDLVLL